MNDLVCYLVYNDASGFTYGLKGVELENVIFAFYLLKNGKKYEITGYQEDSHIEYRQAVDTGVYQAVAFFKIKLESGKYSTPFIIKSEPVTIVKEGAINQSELVFNRRSIRLKEWGVNILKDFEPSIEYLQHRCSSLSRKKYRLKTDGFGFIVNSQKKQQLTRDRVIFLGASQVECLYVEEGKRLSDQFQNQRLNFEILNGGYSGTTSLQVLNTLLNKVLQRLPKKIYFFLPTNDIYAFRSGGYWNDTKRFSPIMPEKSMKHGKRLEQEHWAKELFKIYSVIKSTCDIYNIKTYFVTFPHVTNLENNYIVNTYDVDVANELINDRIYLNKLFKDIVISIGGNLIDLERLLNFDETCFYDDVHFNEEGCLKAANILVQYSTFDEGK